MRGVREVVVTRLDQSTLYYKQMSRRGPKPGDVLKHTTSSGEMISLVVLSVDHHPSKVWLIAAKEVSQTRKLPPR
jgi:hypothetical protein